MSSWNPYTFTQSTPFETNYQESKYTLFSVFFLFSFSFFKTDKGSEIGNCCVSFKSFVLMN